METFPKIDTLWNRDEHTFTVIPGQYRRPEFAHISRWLVSEKIDGTNIRLIFSRDFDVIETGPPAILRWHENARYEARGKTDKAQMPGPLGAALNTLCARILPEMSKILEEYDLQTCTLYGEGYGPGIQSGGYYRDDPAFILFDVKADGTWLAENAVEDTALRLGVDRVPQLINPYADEDDNGLLWPQGDIVRYISTGDCLTTFAKEQREAEGVIAKSPVPLFNARGQRVMWKLKGRDFRAGKR